MPSKSVELSDHEEDDDFNIKSKNRKKNSRVFDNSDSDNDSSNSDSDKGFQNEENTINRHSSSVESHNVDLLNMENNSPEPGKDCETSKRKGPIRKSKLNALEEIHSESQRIVRESNVSLPYHRPKQRSLAEFLNRRKSIATVPLKATKEKLTEVWQQIEQREKMAETFYNSDSDESDTEINKCNIENSEPKDSICDNIIINNTVEESQIEINSTLKTDCNNKELENITSIAQETDQCTEAKIVDDTDVNNELIENNIILKESPSIAVTNVDHTKDLDKSKSEHAFPKVPSSVDIFADSDTNAVGSFDFSLSFSNDEIESSESNVLKSKLSATTQLNLNSIPRISDTEDGVINLDEQLPKSGPLKLMKRFMKHITLERKKVVKNEELSIVSTEVNEKGEVTKLLEENVNIVNEEPKLILGKKLDSLKAILQQKMSLSRGQQLAKRMQEYRLYEDEIEPEAKVEKDELENEEEEIEDLTETESESEEEEDLVDIEPREKKVKNPFLDDEAEDTEDEGSELDGEPYESNERFHQMKEKDLQNLLGSQFKENVSNSQSSEAMDNLLDLCSGNFSSQALKLSDLEENDQSSQNLETEINETEKDIDNISNEDDSDEEFIISKNKNRKLKVYISDNDSEDEENSTKDDFFLTDKNGSGDKDDSNGHLKSGVDLNGKNESEVQLDEDEDIQSNLNEDEDVQSNLNEEEDEENYEEDEEDELARKIGQGFLDGEAELSGSDWDSADEDEKDLDELEEEDGDEDKISQRKLQKELGRIHFKEVMAEDKREVRLLQELLLEDGELHSDGPKRQRIFRWYNDDNDNMGPDKNVEGDEGDIYGIGDEDDETWRRTRTEREKFLREKNIDNLEDIRDTMDTSKLNLSKNNGINLQLSQNLLKSPDPKQKFTLINKRGSFLNRSEKILNKLAQISTNCTVNENPIGSSKGKKNMVFAVVSPPKLDETKTEEVTLKRKSEPCLTVPVKKLRFSTDLNNSKKISLLEQLRQSDMNLT